MKNLWNSKDHNVFLSKYKKLGYSEDIASRVYTSRLLGSNSKLVLHGGGNTSVKTKQTDINDIVYDVICVKGSGWDLDSIEPDGLPAIKLEPLLKLRYKNNLSDDEMVNYQKRQLLDIKSPNPSVETFLHAFLPHKFVDHTHSNSILTLTNRTNGFSLCKEIFDEKVQVLPYIMPGFKLARAVNDVYEKYPHINCIILMNHGIFTFSDSSKESYNLMIKYVTLAEKCEAKIKSKKIKCKNTNNKLINIQDVLPVLRGNLDNYFSKKSILSFRTNKNIIRALENIDIIKSLHKGTITPDHVIRIKPFPLFISQVYLKNLNLFKNHLEKEIEKYHTKYISYFKKNNRYSKSKKIILNTCPLIIYLQGLGMVSVGNNSILSNINADIAEQNINVISTIERTERYKTISQRDLFNVEYWSLEQAKIKKINKDLLGNIVVITGGAGVIGEATLKLFKSQGAEVIVIDINEKQLKIIKERYDILTISCDVTDKKSVKSAFNKIVNTYGGIDILISNAGIAPQGPIARVSEDLLRKSFEVNFFSHQNCASEATNIMIKQNSKGCLIFNISKQSVNPGKYFGPYGLPKAALLNLCKQYALDYGEYGIRSNGINADRIMSGLLDKKMIEKRSKARNLTIDQYMKGNLLAEEVYAVDVAKGFLHLALSKKSTGAVLTIDGGNIAASLR